MAIHNRANLNCRFLPSFFCCVFSKWNIYFFILVFSDTILFCLFLFPYTRQHFPCLLLYNFLSSIFVLAYPLLSFSFWGNSLWLRVTTWYNALKLASDCLSAVIRVYSITSFEIQLRVIYSETSLIADSGHYRGHKSVR